MEYLFEDVNLSSIFFSKNGRTLNIEFINMHDGGFLAGLILDHLMIFNYNNAFDDDEEGLPVYVGEVTCRELTAKEAPLELLRLGYLFIKHEGGIIGPAAGKLFLLHIAGGEVSIDIVCGNYNTARRIP
ncbi:MAG: hypothetical protein PHU14_01940 [Methylovulum sp.]|nr:hypothetical protein [Methylovulum sp.]